MFADGKEIYLLKKEQRKVVAAKRKKLRQEEWRQRSRDICMHLEALFAGPEFQNIRNVFSYRAMPEEANVDSFNRLLEQSGRRVAYPICLAHGILQAALPLHADAWRRGAYDIAEPDPDRSQILLPEQVDAVLVPCLAFDRQGNRCGHGAGYYDRYLPLCRPETILVMSAFDIQELEQVVTEETDRRICRIVTESGCIRVE